MKLQSDRLLTTVLALGVIAAPLSPTFTMVARAGEVGVSQSSSSRSVKAPNGRGQLNPDAAPKNLKVPDSVQKVVDLKQSLSARQQSEIKSILGRYQSQLKDLSSSFTAPVDPSSLKSIGESPKPGTDGFNAKVATDKAALAKSREASQKLTDLQDKINKEISGVLNSKQAAVFQASQKEARSLLDQVNQATKDDSASTQSATATSYAYSAGYYASLGTYYAYYAYLYNYYSYIYESTNSYAYYAYLYSYYSYYSYGKAGLGYAGASYFNNLALGYGFDGDEGNAEYYLYYAYDYSYYAYLNAYYNYYYYGGVYSYYGYLYGSYAQSYLYDAWYYAYYSYYTS